MASNAFLKGGRSFPRVIKNLAWSRRGKTPLLLVLLLSFLFPVILKAREVQNGIDVLELTNFGALQGRRVGLITNHTGIDRHWNSTIDVLKNAPGVTLVALFSPEHGIRGVEDRPVASSVDEKTGLPIYSLYEPKVRRPTEEMLKGIDTLVFDIQDVGARFYTYSTTLAYTMEAAAKYHLKYVVLDRPNPITGMRVEGPALDAKQVSFVGYFSGMSTRHGMTVGEMAQMFNKERKIGADLQVIPMRGWRRWQWFDEDALPWVNPSPNMRNLPEAILYPAVATLEGTNVSVGRGTDTPFEVLGAPWIDGMVLADKIQSYRLAGVRVYPIRFAPQTKPFLKERCGGVFLMVVERDSFDAAHVLLGLISALEELYPNQFQIDKILPLLGNEQLLRQIKNHAPIRTLFKQIDDEEEAFKAVREKYLIYK
ncbi:MAG: DUF1343 domain-containing protein [Acidobacteriia bacterium]|nr:DUF1343 domain-containing protein [Terriglobia bacterium]